MMKKNREFGDTIIFVLTVNLIRGSQAIIFMDAKVKTLIAFATAYFYALNATGKQMDRMLTR
jgi:hypothetical protein